MIQVESENVSVKPRLVSDLQRMLNCWPPLAEHAHDLSAVPHDLLSSADLAVAGPVQHADEPDAGRRVLAEPSQQQGVLRQVVLFF